MNTRAWLIVIVVLTAVAFLGGCGQAPDCTQLTRVQVFVDSDGFTDKRHVPVTICNGRII